MPTEIPELTIAADKKTAVQQQQLFKWQNRLLPWLIAMPTVLIFLFLYLATQQVNRFNEALNLKSVPVSESILSKSDSSAQKKFKTDIDYIRWITLVKMEEESINKRYEQGGLLL